MDDGEICSLNVIVQFEPHIGLKLNSASLLLVRGYSNFSFVYSHLPTSRCSRVCVGGEIMCFCMEVQKVFFSTIITDETQISGMWWTKMCLTPPL